MLIVASLVFTYYTIWTLLMVHCDLLQDLQALTTNTPTSALRRRLAPRTNPLPSPRLGHPNPRHHLASGRSRGRQFPQRGNGAEQSQKGSQSGKSQAAEGAVVLGGGNNNCLYQKGARGVYWDCEIYLYFSFLAMGLEIDMVLSKDLWVTLDSFACYFR